MDLGRQRQTSEASALDIRTGSHQTLSEDFPDSPVSQDGLLKELHTALGGRGFLSHAYSSYRLVRRIRG